MIGFGGLLSCALSWLFRPSLIRVECVACLGAKSKCLGGLGDSGGEDEGVAGTSSSFERAGVGGTEEGQEFADGSRLLFPSPKGKSLSDSALSKLLSESGVQEVPLGFRSSFRDRCADAERTGEIVEAVLAHTYCSRRRGSLFPERCFRAATRRGRGMGRLHRRVRTNLTARTMAAACTVPEPSARRKRPFVAKLRRSRQLSRPISRRNRIICGSEQIEAGERTSHGRSGQQSIRLGSHATGSIRSFSAVRQPSETKKDGFDARPPRLTSPRLKKNPDAKIVRVRVCAHVAVARARCVSPCGAKH